MLLNEFRRQAERAEFMVVTLEGRDADGGPKAVRAMELAPAGASTGRPWVEPNGH